MPTTSNLVLFLVIILSIVQGCTLVHVHPNAFPNTLIIGRTLEYGPTKFDGGIDMDTMLMIVPRGRNPLFAHNNSVGFAVIGAGKSGTTMIAAVDGMNEYGLTVSAHTLHQSQYERASTDEVQVNFKYVLPWILGTFKDINELEQGISSIRIVGSASDEANFVHWAVQDASGRSIVMEVIEGEIRIHENTVGVFTNDPDWVWHLRNLNQYTGITNRDMDFDKSICVDTEEAGFVPILHSHGLNLNALPGGMSPSARFVRMYFLRALSVKSASPKTIKDGLVLVQSLINAVQIPRGAVSRTNVHDDFEFTQWSILKLPKQRLLWYRGYRDGGWRKFDFNKVKWHSGTLSRIKIVKLSSPTRGSGGGWGNVDDVDDDVKVSDDDDEALIDGNGDHHSLPEESTSAVMQ